MWLVPSGPWQLSFLLRLQDSLKPPGAKIEMTKAAREQMTWWLVNLQAAREESKILDPRPMGSMNPVHIYTDAAGGDAGSIRNGIGGFTPPHEWFYMPWPQLIRDNRANTDGVKFAHKMCSLEGFGALMCLATIPDLVRNREVIIHCDNAAFVAVYRKKHSKCAYAYTVAKALFDVGEGLACRIKVRKTKRCSGPGEEAADALSKGDWNRAWDNMPDKNTDPGRIPKAALKWIQNPTASASLGEEILKSMSAYTDVLI